VSSARDHFVFAKQLIDAYARACQSEPNHRGVWLGGAEGKSEPSIFECHPAIQQLLAERGFTDQALLHQELVSASRHAKHRFLQRYGFWLSQCCRCVTWLIGRSVVLAPLLGLRPAGRANKKARSGDSQPGHNKKIIRIN
jgi:hypothetical protein